MTTTTNWRVMTAGRELDMAVAQCVIGGDLTFIGDGDEIYIYRDGIDDHDGVAYDVLGRYSTDLNAAWELLPINRHIRIVRHTDRGGAAHGTPNEIGAEIWNCDISPSVMEVVGFGDTPALAICRAFLAWNEAQL